jgi:hypothetical protein
MSLSAVARALVQGSLIALCGLALGCKSQCRQLSEKLCECQPTTADREACLRKASNEEGRIQPTAENEETCAALLPGCDCKAIDTAEGKRACGLAR